MTDGLVFDEQRPLSWIDAFPWLRGASSSAHDTWWDDAIDDAHPVLRRQRLVQVAELAMVTVTRWTVGQIFPGLSIDIDLRDLQLPARAFNILDRQGYRRTGDLTGIVLDEMLEWRQVGVGTVAAIMEALAAASTFAAVPTVVASEPASQPEPSPTDDRLPEAASALLDDLSQLAAWNATIGLSKRPLLGLPLDEGAPHEIVEACQRLTGLSAYDILTTDVAERDVAALLDEALRTLDQRAAQILTVRLFADDPITFDQIGQEWGVSRERIRQIEGKARGELLSRLSDGGMLELVARTVRNLIGTIRPLEDLLALMPALSRTVEAAGQPAWRVLDRLDDAYQIKDGWCVTPTMTAARTMAQALLQEGADQYGVVRLEGLDLVEASQPERRAELTAAWLRSCGYVIEGAFVLTRTQSVGDYGAAILSIARSPLSSQEIVDRFVVSRSAGSLRNTMSVDDRFERVDRDRWALAEWGLDVYSGVRSLIREQVAHGGGSVSLDHLVEHLTSRYSVTASTVVTHASSVPFETREGVVRMGGNREIHKSPEQTRRLFRHRGAWAYRVRITTDHLRGSGSVAPMAVATIAGLQFGQTRNLDSPLGPQAVSWTGTQPSFGTIRRFLMDGDITADTEAFLVLRDDDTFGFEPVRDATGDAVADALRLIGMENTTDPRAARTAFCEAIGLSENVPVASLIGAYRDRGDTDIADLLTDAREVLETPARRESAAPSTDIDAILDLLQ